ncbi:MAG: 30S ribosomal protein S12 methylthiotransferase RimO [Alistipes sp.]|nr:30S ribosomal protein S12 methylthiotransferase RimO [Candidatus Alistipes equi]
MTLTKTLNLITMGCSKNLVDSEHLASYAARAGYRVIFDSNRLNSDTIVINTCGFIGDAKKESIDMILRAVNAKQKGKVKHLYVIGCLSERYKEELREEIPEVDDYFGARSLKEIIYTLGAKAQNEKHVRRLQSTPKHYAYLKISEGCDWMCGYCAIPLIRGRHRSVPIETLLEEAQNLADSGVKELIVVAQDSTFYGMDLYGKRMLAKLLKSLCKIEEIKWIRLHYAYPTDFPEDVIEVIASEKKICNYIDIPFQHISDNMLLAMRRRHTKQDALSLIEKLRKRIPDIAIRTTLMVGYPTETEQDIEELCDFVQKTKFERLGVFTYSEEEGTYSATKLLDNISEDEKQRRKEIIMEMQREVSSQRNNALLGKEIEVMIDYKEGEFYIGRTYADSPEVDGEVIISSTRRLHKGCIYLATITAAEEYDLYATI